MSFFWNSYFYYLKTGTVWSNPLLLINELFGLVFLMFILFFKLMSLKTVEYLYKFDCPAVTLSPTAQGEGEREGKIWMNMCSWRYRVRDGILQEVDQWIITPYSKTFLSEFLLAQINLLLRNILTMNIFKTKCHNQIFVVISISIY